MDINGLKQALDGYYDAGLFTMPAAALSTPINDLLVQVLRTSELRIENTAGPVVSGDNVRVTGTAPLLYNFTNASVDARFYLSGGATGDPELALTIFLPEGWTFVGQYPQLAGTVFESLGFSPEPKKRFLFASSPYTDPETNLRIVQGLNFYGALVPAASGTVFGTITSILGSFLQITTVGPIAPGPHGPQIRLVVNYNETLQRYFPSLFMPVDVLLLNEIDQTGRYGRAGVLFTVSFSLGTIGVTLNSFLDGTELGIITIEANFTGLAIPPPFELLKLIGGNGEVVDTLPEQYQIPGAVTIQMIRFTIAVTSPKVLSVQIVVAALPDDGWDVVPGYLKVKDVGAIFLVNDPFGAARTFNTTVFGEINVPTENPILLMEAYAQYADDFTIGAGLVPDTSFNLTQLLATFIPAVKDGPNLNFTDLGLEIEFTEPKTHYTFAAALTDIWTFTFGGTSVLEVQYASMQIDNYSNAGESGGIFTGVITILGADMAFSYVMPGEFSLNAHIPQFDVDLQQIANDLMGGWNAPDWFPSFTFPETNIAITIRLDNGQSTYSFHMDANPSVGRISLDVLRYNGTWAFAAGILIRGGKISDFPGLEGLTAFDDFLTLKDLVMEIATQDLPSGPGLPLALPPQPHPLARQPQFLIRGRRLVQFRSLAGARGGVFIRGGIELRDTGDQRTLAKFLGIDGLTLDLSLFLGANPAQNSRIEVSFTLLIQDTLDLACTFGAELRAAQFSIYLEGRITVTLQDQPLIFQVRMTFVPTGAFIAGSMLGTISFWVFQISNLAMVIGINLEGIPSFGIAAQISVSSFNSSIAVFFDSTRPSRSMLAGSVSDITLQDVVDELVGIAQHVPEPGFGAADILDQIGIFGTKRFNGPAELGRALDERDVPVIQRIFAENGVTIPGSITEVLINSTEPDQIWFLTDMTTMKHYDMVRKSADVIEVALEAELYLVPEAVDLGGITFTAGYRINGIIQFLIIRVQLNIEIATNKGISADVLVDPIVIYSDKFFALTGFDGTGGPQLSLSTYTRTDPGLPPEWQKPHFFLNGRFNFLGIEIAAFYVNINSSGFLFDIRGEYFTGTSYEIAGYFKSLNELGASGSAFIGIDRSADLGPLGTIALKVGVSGSVSVTWDGTTARATFSGGFVFQSHEFTIGPLELDVNAEALKHLASTVFEEAVDAIEQFLLEDVEKWLEWVEKGILTGIEDIASVLSGVFGYISDAIWGDDGQVITTIHELLRKTEAASIDIRWSIQPPPDLELWIEQWANDLLERQVNESVARARMLIAPENATSFEMSMVESFVVTYRESQVIPWAINPQEPAPSIPSLGFSFSDFFSVVDLREFRTSVQVNVDFSVVNDVVVTVYYPTLTTNRSYRFTSPDESFLFLADWDTGSADVYQIEYDVSFREAGQPPFRSGRLTRSQSMIVINPPSIGIRRVTFNARNVDWDNEVERVQINFFYLNSAGEPPLQANFELTRSHDTELVQSRYMLPVIAPYTYTATWFLRDGTRLTVPSVSSNAETQFLRNPLQSTFINVISTGIVDGAEDISSIFLGLSWEPDGSASLQLDAETPFTMVPMSVADPSTAVVQYNGTILYKNGDVVQIPDTSTTDPSIITGNVPPWFGVRIDPSVIAWETQNIVQVAVDVFNQNEHGTYQRVGFIFRPDTPVRWWGFFLTPETPDYTWHAKYFFADGTSRSVGPTTSTSPNLILPFTPPA
ncbi:MAG TPA: hypothetical protein VF266_16955 [Thermoanaerobaculia bacterium]